MMIIIEALARHPIHCSPALPPPLFQLEAMSGVVAPATPVCWRCALRLLNQPYLMLYTNTQYTHTKCMYAYARKKLHRTFGDYLYQYHAS